MEPKMAQNGVQNVFMATYGYVLEGTFRKRTFRFEIHVSGLCEAFVIIFSQRFGLRAGATFRTPALRCVPKRC